MAAGRLIRYPHEQGCLIRALTVCRKRSCVDGELNSILIMIHLNIKSIQANPLNFTKSFNLIIQPTRQAVDLVTT